MKIDDHGMRVSHPSMGIYVVGDGWMIGGDHLSPSMFGEYHHP